MRIERIAQAAYATTRITVSDVPHRDRKAKNLCQLAIIEPSQVIDCLERWQGEHLDHWWTKLPNAEVLVLPG